jgi:hypothetical protein
MNAAIRALMTEVIDYAGLFPPAALSLDESIRNYAKYLASDDRWMLGKFICPAAKLVELQPYVTQLFSSAQVLTVSALGRGGATHDEFVAANANDRREIEAFTRQSNGRAVVAAIETKAPAELRGVDFTNMYLESPSPRRDAGFKLRTGGVEASAFPPVEKIARAIRASLDLGTRIKFTAGLHHPIRHFNQSVNTKMHGFINVFVAGVLAHAHKLEEGSLVQILSDEDPASFRFTDDGLRYRDFAATIDQINAARQRVISFGSCSFDEPREDLRALGWL